MVKEFKYFFSWNNVRNVVIFDRVKKILQKLKKGKDIDADELRKKMKKNDINQEQPTIR
jgi:hypothetical protein